MARLTTDRQVRTVPAGRHTASGCKGLILDVSTTGRSRSWILRIQRDGRRHDIGLGPYPEVGLAGARERALARRRAIVAENVPPLAHRSAPRGLTFRAAAEACVAAKAADWKNAKHRQQWKTTLAEYAHPLLGARDVKTITTADVLAVLEPIWTTKHVTARRLRQRIEIVLGHATAAGARSGLNPARWKDNLSALLPRMAKKSRRVRHLAALDWREAPAFWPVLAGRWDIAARALAYVVLTACRSGEARGATWGEVDESSATWIIPAERTKSGVQHRVPLTAAARAEHGPRGEAGELLFPAPSDPRKPLTDAALGKALKRMCRAGLTVHGFRSTFRDWAGEATAHPREVIEHALGHRIADEAEAAYARGDLLAKRRKLMEDWAAYLGRAEQATVLPLERKVS
jgi:integrase